MQRRIEQEEYVIESKSNGLNIGIIIAATGRFVDYLPGFLTENITQLLFPEDNVYFFLLTDQKTLPPLPKLRIIKIPGRFTFNERERRI
jgi:hypothetical protein